jgi:plastocyanin domain-containing protein
MKRFSISGLLALVVLTAGCGGTGGRAEGPADEPAANVVEVTVDGQGFHPDRIPARAGQPVTLAITRTTEETCGTEIVMPAMGIERKLPLNEKVELTITPKDKGEIAFACGMDMMKGTIVVD